MSAKTMAASKGNRRIGCSVTSAAISGLRQKAMKSDALVPQLAVLRQDSVPPGA